MLRPLLAAALLAAPFPGLSQAAPQQPQRERYVQIAEGERCPRSTDEEVVVCGVVRQDEQYRIPERFREGVPGDQVNNTERVLDMMSATDSGTQSCSNVGPGGFTGCFLDGIGQWKATREQARRERERAVVR